MALSENYTFKDRSQFMMKFLPKVFIKSVEDGTISTFEVQPFTGTYCADQLKQNISIS